MRPGTELHRCRNCGTIAEWHYVLARGPQGDARPAFRVQPGTKAYAAGQGVVGNQPHIVDPDMSHPLNPVTLQPVAA